MKVNVLEHGSPETAQALFCMIGPWVLSKEVLQRLGMAVTAEKGDRWFVAVSDDGRPMGFAQGRRFKNGTLHVRYLLAGEGGEETEDALIGAIMAYAGEAGVKTVYSNDRRSASVWPRHWFVCAPVTGRKNFVRWVSKVEKKET